jgi:membrane protein
LPTCDLSKVAQIRAGVRFLERAGAAAKTPTSPVAGNLGVAHFLKSRFLSLCVIVVIGCLLLVSLVASTALMAFSDYLDRTLPNFSIILYLIHHALSFGFTTVFFAVILRYFPIIL